MQASWDGAGARAVSKPSLPPGTRSAAKKLSPLDVARADHAAGRFSTLRAEQMREDGPKGYWYVGHHVDVPLRQGGPAVALKFETLAGPFTVRGAADKVIERARARADREA
jgi:hypothetical protein